MKILAVILAILGVSQLAVDLFPNFSTEGNEVKANGKQKVEENHEHWEDTLRRMTEQCIQPEEVKKPKVESLFPKRSHLRLIGRLAEGITQLKLKQNGWYECGVLYKDRESIYKKALKYSYEIVRACYIMSDKIYKVNVWGLAGVIENESNFDRCALGLYPRKHAYKLGVLEKKKFCISHTEEEVLFALENTKIQKKFKKTGVDLGVGQVLSRFYDRPTDYRAMMQIDYGTMQAAKIMRNRGRWYGTKRPWLYWRGTKTEWYDKKVTRRARKLGATVEEI
jgi:hypothetical protein